MHELKKKRPMIIRIVGTREKEAKKMFWESGIQVIDDLEEAAEQAVELAKR